jgi:DDE domain
VKVKGQWVYLYRAVDKGGDTIDFYLSPTRNIKAAKRSLGKALKGLKDWQTAQDQHRQGPDLWSGDRRTQERGKTAR